MSTQPSQPIILSNRYQLDERIGSGGMAMVFRATDRMLERQVAIKLLRTDYSQDDSFRERFRQEAKAAANLAHPNIVTVHDFGLDAGRLYIIMEYVPGVDLKALIQQKGRFSVEEALPLLIQACAGIGYAHRSGLVHCDIKPQNMLVTPDGRLKVVDFGIALALASISPDDKTDVVWGSPQYFSPEQAGGSAPSPASDVYSLGVVMYEMLTGRPPFSAPTTEELARAHRDDPVPSARKYNPSIPLQLEQIILKVLAKEPSQRYRTADQLGRVLVTLAEQSETATSTHTPLVVDEDPSESLAPAPAPPRQQVIPAPQPPVIASAPIAASRFPARPGTGTDWLTWILALLALIAVGGLIPFCLWVYYALNPPL
ncbi:MAG TPA: protein kinase [Anaerolineales bacterium]|nr:protein kinase [Anaerolineales bacterium]